ncbi:DegT/DnrJ/EryC1/StrS family aminotransferase [Cohnella sp. 56]|uniref:DegT/DnrJ/EryC1/StrS family aminotransferase n=1 Tax=Cohnella sp. 56 TaxID=3113722 RepID=UPI0030E95BEA
MNIPLLNLSRQHEVIQSKLTEALLKVVDSNNYIMGAEVRAFEAEIAAFLGCRHAISCGNGTDALVLSLKALGIGAGDEVITSPFTFFATAEAVSAVGATPVFVDVDPVTFNIDAAQIESKITVRTKAILPVHVFGQPADMDALLALARRYRLHVVEDGCQAIGASYKGSMAGTMGDIGCFSFFPTKNLGALGDGGLIVTNDDRLAAILKGLRVHGSGPAGLQALKAMQQLGGGADNASTVRHPEADDPGAKYYNYVVGANSRLDEIQAAVLRIKLPHLKNWNEDRIRLADVYRRELSVSCLQHPALAEDVIHVHHLYIVQSACREELISYLNEKGIATGIYYPVPLHLQKVYERLGYREGDLPVAEYLSTRTFALPLYPGMSDSEQNYIIAAILQFEKERMPQ